MLQDKVLSQIHRYARSVNATAYSAPRGRDDILLYDDPFVMELRTAVRVAAAPPPSRSNSLPLLVDPRESLPPPSTPSSPKSKAKGAGSDKKVPAPVNLSERESQLAEQLLRRKGEILFFTYTEEETPEYRAHTNELCFLLCLVQRPRRGYDAMKDLHPLMDLVCSRDMLQKLLANMTLVWESLCSAELHDHFSLSLRARLLRLYAKVLFYFVVNHFPPCLSVQNPIDTETLKRLIAVASAVDRAAFTNEPGYWRSLYTSVALQLTAVLVLLCDVVSLDEVVRAYPMSGTPSYSNEHSVLNFLTFSLLKPCSAAFLSSDVVSSSSHRRRATSTLGERRARDPSDSRFERSDGSDSPSADDDSTGAVAAVVVSPQVDAWAQAAFAACSRATIYDVDLQDCAAGSGSMLALLTECLGGGLFGALDTLSLATWPYFTRGSLVSLARACTWFASDWERMPRGLIALLRFSEVNALGSSDTDALTRTQRTQQRQQQRRRRLATDKHHRGCSDAATADESCVGDCVACSHGDDGEDAGAAAATNSTTTSSTTSRSYGSYYSSISFAGEPPVNRLYYFMAVHTYAAAAGCRCRNVSINDPETQRLFFCFDVYDNTSASSSSSACAASNAMIPRGSIDSNRSSTLAPSWGAPANSRRDPWDTQTGGASDRQLGSVIPVETNASANNSVTVKSLEELLPGEVRRVVLSGRHHYMNVLHKLMRILHFFGDAENIASVMRSDEAPERHICEASFALFDLLLFHYPHDLNKLSQTYDVNVPHCTFLFAKLLLRNYVDTSIFRPTPALCARLYGLAVRHPTEFFQQADVLTDHLLPRRATVVQQLTAEECTQSTAAMTAYTYLYLRDTDGECVSAQQFLRFLTQLGDECLTRSFFGPLYLTVFLRSLRTIMSGGRNLDGGAEPDARLVRERLSPHALVGEGPVNLPAFVHRLFEGLLVLMREHEAGHAYLYGESTQVLLGLTLDLLYNLTHAAPALFRSMAACVMVRPSTDYVKLPERTTAVYVLLAILFHDGLDFENVTCKAYQLLGVLFSIGPHIDAADHANMLELFRVHTTRKSLQLLCVAILRSIKDVGAGRAEHVTLQLQLIQIIAKCDLKTCLTLVANDAHKANSSAEEVCDLPLCKALHDALTVTDELPLLKAAALRLMTTLGMQDAVPLPRLIEHMEKATAEVNKLQEAELLSEVASQERCCQQLSLFAATVSFLNSHLAALIQRQPLYHSDEGSPAEAATKVIEPQVDLLEDAFRRVCTCYHAAKSLVLALHDTVRYNQEAPLIENAAARLTPEAREELLKSTESIYSIKDLLPDTRHTTAENGLNTSYSVFEQKSTLDRQRQRHHHSSGGNSSSSLSLVSARRARRRWDATILEKVADATYSELFRTQPLFAQSGASNRTGIIVHAEEELISHLAFPCPLTVGTGYAFADTQDDDRLNLFASLFDVMAALSGAADATAVMCANEISTAGALSDVLDGILELVIASHRTAPVLNQRAWNFMSGNLRLAGRLGLLLSNLAEAPLTDDEGLKTAIRFMGFLKEYSAFPEITAAGLSALTRYATSAAQLAATPSASRPLLCRFETDLADVVNLVLGKHKEDAASTAAADTINACSTFFGRNCVIDIRGGVANGVIDSLLSRLKYLAGQLVLADPVSDISHRFERVVACLSKFVLFSLASSCPSCYCAAISTDFCAMFAALGRFRYCYIEPPQVGDTPALCVRQAWHTAWCSLLRLLLCALHGYARHPEVAPPRWLSGVYSTLRASERFMLAVGGFFQIPKEDRQFTLWSVQEVGLCTSIALALQQCGSADSSAAFLPHIQNSFALLHWYRVPAASLLLATTDDEEEERKKVQCELVHVVHQQLLFISNARQRELVLSDDAAALRPIMAFDLPVAVSYPFSAHPVLRASSKGFDTLYRFIRRELSVIRRHAAAAVSPGGGSAYEGRLPESRATSPGLCGASTTPRTLPGSRADSVVEYAGAETEAIALHLESAQLALGLFTMALTEFLHDGPTHHVPEEYRRTVSAIAERVLDLIEVVQRDVERLSSPRLSELVRTVGAVLTVILQRRKPTQ